jgi:hypothetical protein
MTITDAVNETIELTDDEVKTVAEMVAHDDVIAGQFDNSPLMYF